MRRARTAGLGGRADVIEDLEAPFVELTELTPPPLEGLDRFGPVMESRGGPLTETDGHLAHVPCRDRVGDENPARVGIDGEAHIRFGSAMDRLDDAAADDPDVPQGEPEHVARLHRQESGGERSRAREVLVASDGVEAGLVTIGEGFATSEAEARGSGQQDEPMSFCPVLGWSHLPSPAPSPGGRRSLRRQGNACQGDASALAPAA